MWSSSDQLVDYCVYGLGRRGVGMNGRAIMISATKTSLCIHTYTSRYSCFCLSSGNTLPPMYFFIVQIERRLKNTEWCMHFAACTYRYLSLSSVSLLSLDSRSSSSSRGCKMAFNFELSSSNGQKKCCDVIRSDGDVRLRCGVIM
jgi:hypothetical protein